MSVFEGSNELAELYAELHLSCRRATAALHERNKLHGRSFASPLQTYIREEARASQLWERISRLRRGEHDDDFHRPISPLEP